MNNVVNQLTVAALGMPPFQKSAVFLNIVQKAFDPPPFYLNICPILQGVFLNAFLSIKNGSNNEKTKKGWKEIFFWV